MKLISPKVHGYLDYVVVLVFLAAPALLHFSGIPAVISYTLAGVHFALTLLTNFPLGLVKLIPLKIHGYIELAVGPCLIALPFVLGLSSEPAALGFYVTSGIVILVVWALTDYKNA
jgi:hypothetical protein